MSWRTLVTLGLLLGALVSGWSVWRQRKQESSAVGRATRSDYVLEEFELVALDKQGRESFTLRAPRLVRDPTERTMDIPAPVFLIPAGNAGSDAWQVRADNGWISADGDELRLRGEVQAASAGQVREPTTIRTEELNVFPETKRPDSPGRVVITRPRSILSGRGLQLNR